MMKRAFWALTVGCLLAATGVRPIGAAEADARAVAQLTDRHPALPAAAAARHAALAVAVRPQGTPPTLPLAVIATPPGLALRVARATVSAPYRGYPRGSAAAPTRSARGPPVG